MNNRGKAALAILYAGNLLLFAGFALHSDTGQELILGKYALPYFLFLIVLLVPLPFLPKFVRFLATPSKRKMKDGLTLEITAQRKVAYLATVTLLAVVLMESFYQVFKSMRPSGKPPDYMLQFHPFLQIVPSELTYTGINRHGFRGPEIEENKGTGVYRIFCLGGSTTFNPFLEFEDSYPRRLEKLLKAKHPNRKIELQNAGMGWYTSQHSLINYLIRVRRFKPDLVVVMHGINDLFRSFSPPAYAIRGIGYRSDYSHFLGPQADLFMDLSQQREPALADAVFMVREGTNFFTRNFFSDLRYRAKQNQAVPVTKFQSLPSFMRNMESLVGLTNSHGVRVILVTQPFFYRPDLTEDERRVIKLPQELTTDGARQADLSSMANGMNQFNEVVRRLAKEKKLPLVDAEPALPKTLEFFKDDVHYTPKGSQRLAEQVAKMIKRIFESTGRIE